MIKMVYITSQQYICDGTRYIIKPYYSGKNILGGRVVSFRQVVDGMVPKYMGIAYSSIVMRAYIMYPKPFHLIARFINWLNYWSYLPVGNERF